MSYQHLLRFPKIMILFSFSPKYKGYLPLFFRTWGTFEDKPAFFYKTQAGSKFAI